MDTGTGRRLLTLVLALLSFVGCSDDEACGPLDAWRTEWGPGLTAGGFQAVRPGMTRSEVADLLGVSLPQPYPHPDYEKYSQPLPPPFVLDFGIKTIVVFSDDDVVERTRVSCSGLLAYRCTRDECPEPGLGDRVLRWFPKRPAQ